MTQHARLGKATLRFFARRVRAALFLACSVLGCGATTNAKDRLEVYSWWKRPSEQRAIENVLRLYNRAHPDSEAFNQVTDTNADAVRETLTARLLAGAPPSTFQANAGADLLRWTVVDTTNPEVPSSSRIAKLSGFFAKNGLFDVLPTALSDTLLAGPEHAPYAVPINIHRLNVLYYNTAALAAFGTRNSERSFLDPNVLCPADLEEKLADPLAKLDVKIAVGKKDSFALVLFAIESVLPAVAGAKLYDQLFRGQAIGDWSPPVRRALRCAQYLSRSFLDGRNDNWADALAQVQTGTADFSVMGDWGNGELALALERGDVQACPFPGSETTFVFTSDSFPLPVGAPHFEESQALLDTVASKQAQLEFSQEKGSIPARLDVDVSVLGARAMRTRADFASPAVDKVLATSGLFPPYFPDELNARLAAMTAAGAAEADVEGVITLLRDTEPLFVRWQNRLIAPSAVP